MYHFCTYFDSNYLVKGLALYRSLVRHAKPFRLWVLCFDDMAYEILQELALPEVLPISLSDFEEENPDFLQVKNTRSRIEYYFTSTPVLPLYILKNWPEVELITYLDADLFFFSALSPIYQELGSGSVLIVGHRFPPRLTHLEYTGVYNVGLLSFRRDDVGLACLQWWRQQCLEWCYDREEDGRYADQKYLDDWPTRFPGTVVLQHPGAGLGPWNIGNYSLGTGKDSQVLVDSQPLVFFHFHGFKKVYGFLFDPNLANYGMQVNDVLKHHIYMPYIRELQSVILWLSECIDPQYIGMTSVRGISPDAVSIFRLIARKIKRVLIVTKKTLQGDFWIVIGGRIV